MAYRLKIFSLDGQIGLFESLKPGDLPCEELPFDSLRGAVVTGLSSFRNDDHKIVRTHMGAYDALCRRNKREFCLGVSTKRAVYIRRGK